MGAELDTRWFDPARTNLLVGLLIFLAFLTINILRAKRGGSVFIRPLAGLKALDEAIGRATEMGKSVLYLPGLGDMSEVGTLAAITIMSRVARKVADLGCSMQVPCYDPVVMAIMDGVAREAYVEAGRGDEFKPGSVHYVSAQQFAYVAAVTGVMLRERPAAIVYMGSFYAESLFLAETGNLTGAIQIAGCDKVTQLPFFVCACDYTLMGEELFAAGAYIGQEAVQLATIAAQDWAKALAAAMIVLAIALSALGHPELGRLLKAS
ncbi:MAG: hypothetical protein E6K79_03355 [Candidatus Eisenbacteria bacterium]|uniref:DUF6754 domain-containing protein n=1 Tax=Eiseniibacteriota bacterium TaxID=2212470 RepID=A0A538TQN6_UNCEI|nr:MAG: hypothetical protein E6K79_03355 [Candidatus Eisenbacteria bacterium]